MNLQNMELQIVQIEEHGVTYLIFSLVKHIKNVTL